LIGELTFEKQEKIAKKNKEWRADFREVKKILQENKISMAT